MRADTSIANDEQTAATANGKVLLFGEHAVVHGIPAIAASLSRGARAWARLDGKSSLSVPQWDLELTATSDVPLAQAFRAIIDSLQSAPVHVSLACDVPSGAGLGSSAAIAVAIARAIAACGALPGSGELEPRQLQSAAHAAELIFHGNPSGVDTAVAASNGVLWFQRGDEGATKRALPVGSGLHIVVAQVADGANTGTMVSGVGRRFKRCYGPTRMILDGIGQIVLQAESALASGNASMLGELMDINHGLLMALGVSTAELDTGCHVARQAGALGAKLTGAGGGGCIIAVAPTDPNDVVQALRELSPTQAAGHVFVHALTAANLTAATDNEDPL